MNELDPLDFGAAGDGLTDDTDAWQRTVAAAMDGRRIALHGRSYLLRELILQPGLAGIIGPGTFIGAAPINTGLLHCGRTVFEDGAPIHRLLLRDFTIKVAQARCGIEWVGVQDSIIENCRIDMSRNLHKGIWLRDSCSRNILRGNFLLAPPGDNLTSLVCVTIDSHAVDGQGSYFLGQAGIIKYNDSSTRNLIDSNVIEGGTHGIALSNTSHNRIVNNLVTGNHHRNLNLCPACRFNIVSHNQLLEAGSSAVAMAYGTSDNTITDNQISSWHTTPEVDRDAIHAYVASCGNRIAGNVIIGTFRYGVYLAASAQRNQVHDNRIRLSPNPLVPADWSAAIALETDWAERPLPPTARFSRQNYGSPPPQCRWAYEDSTHNLIRHNLIEAATCAIYLAQIDDRGLRANRIENNLALPPVQRALHVSAPSPAMFTENVIQLTGDAPLPPDGCPEWLADKLRS